GDRPVGRDRRSFRRPLGVSVLTGAGGTRLHHLRPPPGGVRAGRTPTHVSRGGAARSGGEAPDRGAEYVDLFPYVAGVGSMVQSRPVVWTIPRDGRSPCDVSGSPASWSQCWRSSAPPSSPPPPRPRPNPRSSWTTPAATSPPAATGAAPPGQASVTARTTTSPPRTPAAVTRPGSAPPSRAPAATGWRSGTRRTLATTTPPRS